MHKFSYVALMHEIQIRKSSEAMNLPASRNEILWNKSL